MTEGRALTTDKPTVQVKTYQTRTPDLSLRAFLPEVQKALKTGTAALVDVRSPQEFTGERSEERRLVSRENCQRHAPYAVRRTQYAGTNR